MWLFDPARGNKNNYKNMDRREELVQLAGQVINGIMSADDSVITKILDRSIHSQVAATAVSIASDMQKEIDKHYN